MTHVIRDLGLNWYVSANKSLACILYILVENDFRVGLKSVFLVSIVFPVTWKKLKFYGGWLTYIRKDNLLALTLSYDDVSFLILDISYYDRL